MAWGQFPIVNMGCYKSDFHWQTLDALGAISISKHMLVWKQFPYVNIWCFESNFHRQMSHGFWAISINALWVVRGQFPSLNIWWWSGKISIYGHYLWFWINHFPCQTPLMIWYQFPLHNSFDVSSNRNIIIISVYHLLSTVTSKCSQPCAPVGRDAGVV